MTRPELVVCDTMNYWIQSKKAPLLELLERVDVLMVNDSEARELSGDWNIHRAGRWILAHGPKRVVIKQGEHGALLIEPEPHVLRAGLPAGERVRPHRRRRRLRRRVHGLPRAHRLGRPRTTSAGPWSYGATMGSYAVEQFGIRGFDQRDARRRARRGCGPSSDLTHVSLAEALGMTSAGRVRGGRRRPGARRRGQGADRPAVAGTRTRALGGQGRRVRRDGAGARRACGKPALVLSTDGVGTKVLVALQAGRFDTVGEDLVNHSVNDILVHGATPIAFMDYIAGSGLGVEQIAGLVEGIARGCRAHGMALAGGETAQMPGLYQPGTYDLAGHDRRRGGGGRGAARRRRSCRATCCSATPRPGSTPTATRWPAASCSTGWGSGSTTALGDTGRTRRRRAARGAPELRARACCRSSAGCTGWRTSPAAASPATWCGSCPPGCEAIVDPASWELPPLFAALQQGGRDLHRRDARGVQPRRRADRRAAGRTPWPPRRRAARAAGVATWPMGEIRRGSPAVRFARP